MLRFVNDKSLSGEALQFMENLKTAAKSDSLAVDDYRFDIKVKNFPRDSLVIEDDDKANVKEFLSKLEFFVGQPSEVELQKIIKDEMRVSFQLTKDETEDSFLKIRNKALDYWRKEGKKMYLKKDDDFLKDIVRFNIKFDVKEPILLFTGRVEMRQELHRILQDESIKIPRVASIAGLGGTGKSSLVRKYVSEHSDEYNGNIIWINAQNYQTLFESFYRLARDNLQINVKCLEGEQRDIKSIVGDVYAFFANRKSLFIFDNAEKLGMQNDDEGIRNFLPSSNDNKPYVLITSRNQKWGDRKVISLGPFTSDEAARFICTALNINSGSQEKQIKELTEILQYFPLALQQAIAYIKQSDEEIKSVYSDKGFEIDDYLEEYKKKAKALLNFPFPDDSDNQYTKTTFTTWHTTIHKIAGSKKSGKNALEILNVIAYCLPYNIPSKMFLKIEKNTRKLGAAVQLLKKYSMVDLENGELSVHRLVQHVTRINLRDQKREKDTLKKAVKLFHDGSKQIDLFANNLRVINVDHALSIWSYIDKYKDLVREFCSLPTLIVSQLHADLRFEEAHSFGSNVLKLFKKILGNNDIAVLSIMNKVASVLYDQGKDVDSLNIYRELEKKSYIINNLIRGRCMFFEINIGLILDRQGKHAEALEIFEKLKTQAKIDDGKINHNIGIVLANLGRLDESLDMLRVALKKKEEMPDPDYESILNTKSNISAFLQRQGKYEEALEMAWEVYDERKKILGEGHPDTLTTYCNIAFVLKYLEKYEEALRISIEVNEKRLELLPNHPRTFKGMLLTAEIFEAQGNYDKALEKVKETYEKRNAYPKYVNPFDIFKIWYRLAVALVSLRIYDKALKELYRIHEEKKILKLSDLQILDTDSLISKVLQAQNEGRLEEDKGVTPLHLAAQNGQVNIVNNLLNQGAAVDAIDYEKGVTSLQLASQNGHVNVVNTLINRGAQVNYKDKMGWMAVHFAARGGHLQVINDLLNQGAAVDAIDYEKVFTPLHIAAQNGQVNIVNTLIDRGADVNSKNKMDSTPLHSAAQEGHLNVILALLNRGAEINVRIIDSGVTPLQLASQNGHVNVVNNLLNQGAAVDAIDYEKGVTSLQLASQNGHVNVVNTLLNRGAQVNYKDKVGWMPVHLAAYGGHLQVITALLNKGAEINVRTIDYGDTPLDLAAQSSANDVAQILQLTKDLFTTMENKNLSESDKVNKLKKHIEKGAILGAVNDGFTTLRVAIKYNFEQIVELLLEKGADATKVTPGKGNTALHIAILKGNKEIVELILKHVSEVVGSNELNKFINTQTTIKGTASIHIAAQNGCLEVVKSLLKYGAIYNIKNKEGKTPIELSSDVDIINLLTLVEKLFESARTGDSEVISKKLKVVKPDEFEAITNACNDESLTLVLFAKANGHTHLASQVSALVLQLSQMDLRSQDVEPGVSGLEQRVSRMKL
ncbi:uncharacterized protein LOC116352218 [Contarinia nasturtii]|uniref:uncharacterized protein LOC116352218 n=1 Tax=Contarinia nasturtii TaxID=265458 RepID=UPI0012D48110|nr:uncharacterized protein LOC116352218 [Contarinia nasturtii]